ncbi:MAG: hypothetical protein GY762_21145 [Proteobacteria bacterium]|nr:hypothetical protein [Pseudomonadota bacterium]
MRYLGNVIWPVPFALHVGYILATAAHLPTTIGGSPGTQTGYFLGTWLTLVALANSAFIFLLIRLPYFGSAMLKVPGQHYWLATRERRDELISRLRGICEVALFSLNIFFIAVYQAVYQHNTVHPYLAIPFPVLVFFFMGVPLFFTVVYMIMAIRGLATSARKHTED